MFVRTLEDVTAAGRYEELFHGDTRSARHLTAADGMGFSLHVNRALVNLPRRLWYKHHREANYTISGRVRSTELTSDGARVVGPNVPHTFEVLEEDHHVGVLRPVRLVTEATQ